MGSALGFIHYQPSATMSRELSVNTVRAQTPEELEAYVKSLEPHQLNRICCKFNIDKRKFYPEQPQFREDMENAVYKRLLADRESNIAWDIKFAGHEIPKETESAKAHANIIVKELKDAVDEYNFEGSEQYHKFEHLFRQPIRDCGFPIDGCDTLDKLIEQYLLAHGYVFTRTLAQELDDGLDAKCKPAKKK